MLQELSSLDPDEDHGAVDSQSLLGLERKVDSRTTLEIVSLTCGMGGLQVLWSTIFSVGTQYLLELGLPKSHTAALWGIPALFGCFVQPYVGLWSDAYYHTRGSRLPFIIYGALGITFSVLSMAWVGELAQFTLFLFGVGDSGHFHTVLEVYALIGVCTLSLAIQPVQCVLRGLPLDYCSEQQQLEAQRWTTVFISTGQVIGAISGISSIASDNTNYSRTFRLLAFLSIIALDLTLIPTARFLSRNQRWHREQTAASASPAPLRMSLLKAYRATSDEGRSILAVQALAWTGWFTFLYYNSSYLSSLYSKSGKTPMHTSDANFAGFIASLMFAVVAFATIILAPPTLVKFMKGRLSSQRGSYQSEAPWLLFFWAIALLWSSALITSTQFIKSPTASIILIGLVGASWAANSWIPMVLIGQNFASQLPPTSEAGRSNVNGSGGISGMYNIAISGPQILAAFIAFLELWIARKVGVDDGQGWVLRSGGAAQFAAAILAIHFAMKARRDE